MPAKLRPRDSAPPTTEERPATLVDPGGTPSPPAAAPATTRGSTNFTEFWLDVDGRFEGRRGRVVGALALLHVLVAPMLDQAVDDLQRLRGLRSTMKDIANIELAGFEYFSLLTLILFIVMAGAILLGRATALATRDDDEDATGSLALRDLAGSLYRMFRTEWRLLALRPAIERWTAMALVVYVGLQTSKSVLSFFRWILWKGLVGPLALEDSWFGRLLVGVYRFEGLLALLGALAMLTMPVAILRWSRQTSTTKGAEGTPEDPHRLRVENPLILLHETGQRHEIAEAFNGKLVTNLLRELSTWKVPDEPGSEARVRDELACHLRAQKFEVAVERHILAPHGRRRLDIVVEDSIALELKVGLKRYTEKDRAGGQVASYAELWKDRGPVLALLVKPHPDAWLPLANQAQRWNRTVQPPAAHLLVAVHSPVKDERTADRNSGRGEA